jgi:hypothetical protein
MQHTWDGPLYLRPHWGLVAFASLYIVTSINIFSSFIVLVYFFHCETKSYSIFLTHSWVAVCARSHLVSGWARFISPISIINSSSIIQNHAHPSLVALMQCRGWLGTLKDILYLCLAQCKTVSRLEGLFCTIFKKSWDKNTIFCPNFAKNRTKTFRRREAHFVF